MAATKAPVPLLSEGEPVDWFFAFKFNSKTFPGCNDDGKTPKVGSKGLFGGSVKDYKIKKDNSGNHPSEESAHAKKISIRHGQQYIVSSSRNPTLTKGNECLGTTMRDPLGATFAQVYFSNDTNYVIWNDQFYGHPGGDPEYPMGHLEKAKNKWINPDIPWGHSKGMLAWNNDGDGFVLQVSTPSWPAAGSHSKPRKKDGNTLGCIVDDDVEVSQHFFCLKINAADLETILKALINSSVVTNPKDQQIVKNGGPANIQALVKQLGKTSSSKDLTLSTLSSGVKLISKPSGLDCPPWQLVSAKLGGLPLRVASWWSQPGIYSTKANTKITCWPASGVGKPGPVEIALSGKWKDQVLGLHGTPTPGGNHAKIGVSTNKRKAFSIFGDMNQMGTLNKILDKENKGTTEKTCKIHQNGRGGLFFVVDNRKLFNNITELLSGDTAPLRAPKKKPKPVKKKTAAKKKSS
jgi:Deoxyribonuclease II